jgi:hypothetical protein
MPLQSKQTRNLVAIKLLHTVIWIILVACILAIPVFGLQGRFRSALILSGVILAECLVLAANNGRCPLTDLASRFTDERADNFDIYLPLWLARHNKTIFGTIFVVGELCTFGRWLILSR